MRAPGAAAAPPPPHFSAHALDSPSRRPAASLPGQTYWQGDQINATIRFPVRVGARGQIGVAFFNGHIFGSVTMALRCGAGPAPCDLHAPVTVRAIEGQRVTTTRIPFRGLPPGLYILEVTAWPGHFGLVAVAG